MKDTVIHFDNVEKSIIPDDSQLIFKVLFFMIIWNMVLTLGFILFIEFYFGIWK